MCEARPARNLWMLDFKGPVGFRGWGCVVCDLACDGAIALLCDRCADPTPPGPQLKFLCAGTYVMQGVRVAYAGFPQVPHVHDRSKHPELQQAT